MERDTRDRILDISYKEKLSHIGSSLGVAEVLEQIYAIKRPEDLIVLDAAHGALGYYAMLEKHEGKDAEELFHKHGVHQNRDTENNIAVSGGSLGLAGTIALGMAIADRERDVYTITSDGALEEGSWSEVLRLKADLKIDNMKIYVSQNGYGAYYPIDREKQESRVYQICPDVQFVDTTMYEYPDYLQGLSAHYVTLNEEQYGTLKK